VEAPKAWGAEEAGVARRRGVGGLSWGRFSGKQGAVGAVPIAQGKRKGLRAWRAVLTRLLPELARLPEYPAAEHKWRQGGACWCRAFASHLQE
jgi:hypothetical protein